MTLTTVSTTVLYCERPHDREDWHHWSPGPAWRGRAHKKI